MIRLKSLGMELLSACNKFYLSPLVCINPKHLSFIIDDTDIDFLSSHLPTSPPIAPALVSVGPEMTVAGEIPLNLFPVKLLLTFINLMSQLIRLKALCKELLISCNTLS